MALYGTLLSYVHTKRFTKLSHFTYKITAGHLKWKENLMEKTSEMFLKRQRETPNLRKLVYGESKYYLVNTI